MNDAEAVPHHRDVPPATLSQVNALLDTDRSGGYVRFEILGPIRVSCRDRPVLIPGERERGLLAMLLLNPDQTMSANRLAEALWDGAAPRNARGQVHSCVSRLRKRLTAGDIPGDVIATDPDGYESIVYNELGRTLLAAGDAAAGLELHQRALQNSQRIRYQAGEARALDGIATCLRDSNPGSARQHWLRALALYQRLDLPERTEVERQLAGLARPSTLGSGEPA